MTWPYNFLVEIPAGTKEKWEVNKRWSSRMGGKKVEKGHKVFAISRKLRFYSSNIWCLW